MLAMCWACMIYDDGKLHLLFNPHESATERAFKRALLFRTRSESILSGGSAGLWLQDAAECVFGSEYLFCSPVLLVFSVSCCFQEAAFRTARWVSWQDHLLPPLFLFRDNGRSLTGAWQCVYVCVCTCLCSCRGGGNLLGRRLPLRKLQIYPLSLCP